MPSKGARESIVRLQAQQVGPAQAAKVNPRPQVRDTGDPTALVLRILDSVNQGLSRMPAPQKMEQAAVFQYNPRGTGTQQNRRTPGQGANDSHEIPFFDPNQMLEEVYGEAGGRAGRQQILQRCSQLLPKLLKHDARAFNFYFPGMGDHVDHPASVMKEYLHQAAAALMFGASSAELKKLKPLLERIHDQIKSLDTQNKPPYSAARPCRDLSYRLGTLMPEHPMVMPIDGH